MGIAAYNRGSRSIARGLCYEYGCYGCSACREYAPTPRPPGWGGKVKVRAAKVAHRILRYMRLRGHQITPVELADMVRQETRAGAKAAQEASCLAFTNSKGGST